MVSLKLEAPSFNRNGIVILMNDDGFRISQSTNTQDLSSVVMIVYDDEVFKHSELILQQPEGSSSHYNHFIVLANLLKQEQERKRNKIWNFLLYLWALLYYIPQASLLCVSKANPVLQYSALGSRLHGFLESLNWCMESLKSERKVSLKVGNYLLATVVDICAGILVLHFLDYLGVTSPLSNYLLKIAKDVVHTLQQLLQWLSGSPAGLKLNGPFNLMMGQFFMYHIKLWWIFLSVAQPVLEFLFTIFLIFGRLGVTFQAAILSDLLALVSFHIYCIYVYAARVYYLQLSGLRALWRLFLGRKHNPLRERVDSCEYSLDQLFVGTLAFTILLFLLPTTLMYYVVFTTMRLILLCLSGILTQACFVFHALPLFATIHWIFRSKRVCRSVYVTAKTCNKDSPVVLYVTPVADTWWNTVNCCLPDTVLCPPRVQFGQLVHKLLWAVDKLFTFSHVNIDHRTSRVIQSAEDEEHCKGMD
ncbi:hypothetical protein ONE63_007776 [Megalurothrips usitatus]|uniref:Phosphatidylinositol N-acetylglucosaminyltransferase subunit Q n=1 Tax=Megalurothrips usitatus TaxID=439358 RepID=A0AAV7XVP0_9NEOP|nr:hypothetical protein ONE63_007776 [Megalurothrips usitatus]